MRTCADSPGVGGPVEFTVNRKLIQIGDKSFATSHVTSVALDSATTTSTAGNSLYPVMVVLVGIVVCFVGVAGGFGTSWVSRVLGGIIGAILVVLPILGFPSGKTETTRVTDYTVRLTTSAGEVELLSTTDKTQAMRLLTAIQDAISEV